MRETGIVRRIDDLGRVVIPKAVRKDMKVVEGDPLELYQMGECVILRKYQEDGRPPALKELDEAHRLVHRRGEALSAANRRIDELEDVLAVSVRAKKIMLDVLEMYASGSIDSRDDGEAAKKAINLVRRTRK